MNLRDDFTRADVERLYRAIADQEPKRELMQLVYDLFGSQCGLRPPVDEMRLAQQCNTGARHHA